MYWETNSHEISMKQTCSHTELLRCYSDLADDVVYNMTSPWYGCSAKAACSTE